MDNGLENMLDMYLFETNSLLEHLDEILLSAEKVETFSSDDVNEIFRIMHTIKGSSAMMEFSSIATIAHRIEDLFYFIRENTMNAVKNEYHQELFNLVFKSVDYLRNEVSNIEQNLPLTENIDNFADEINDFLSKISNQSDNSTVTYNEDIITGNSLDSHQNLNSYNITVFFDEDSGMENLRAFMLANNIKEVCEKFTSEPENPETNPLATSIIQDKGFKLIFQSEKDLNQAVTVIESFGNIKFYETSKNNEYNNKDKIQENKELPINIVAKADKIIPKNTSKEVKESEDQQAYSSDTQNKNNFSGKQSLISVNLSKLDNLLAIIGEIVITESMVISSPDIQGLKLDNFTKSARQLRKLTDDLQDVAMSIRMVPVSGVFNKMQRIVRDMGQKLNKNVVLTLIGENTEVDKTIVDGISDPIMHIVRNSMDHGIETEDERISSGKPAQGEIILSAEHTGSEVIITIQDDGGGADLSKILSKAKASNLLTKPESEYSEKEILQFLFMPGFSTNNEITEFSGRGVGMDVVKKNVEKVGGTITMSSETGIGTKTIMKIPLTLAIADGMEISVGNNVFIIPISNIRQSFKITNDDIIDDSANGKLVERMGSFYPIIRLHELYGIENAITNIEEGILVWVESGDKSYCLFVDELLGEQQVVVKPLPVYLNRFDVKENGIAGCTILGDGSISIILDIINIYKAFTNMN